MTPLARLSFAVARMTQYQREALVAAERSLRAAGVTFSIGTHDTGAQRGRRDWKLDSIKGAQLHIDATGADIRALRTSVVLTVIAPDLADPADRLALAAITGDTSAIPVDMLTRSLIDEAVIAISQAHLALTRAPGDRPALAILQLARAIERIERLRVFF